jgi:hypothetical protein
VEDYDGDGKTDLGGWDPVTGKAWALPTVGSFTYTATQMPVSCVARPDGGTADGRAGCVPVPGVARSISGVRRGAISVWDANSGNWSILWNPGTDPAADSSCWFGQAADVPLALDLLPGSAHSASRLAVFRYGGTASESILHLIGDGQWPNWCNFGMWHARAEGIISERVRVFVVADMTGDHLPEVVHYDQEAGVVKWYNSPGYTTVGGQVSLGNGLAQFL